MKEKITVKIRHFIGSFFSEKFRENFILWSKKDTRKIILQDIKYKHICNFYTFFNSVKIGTEKQDYSQIGKTAIQIHVFYTELLDELYNGLKNITVNYDLYITTNTSEKQQVIIDYFNQNIINAQKIQVDVIENVGRDVWPMIKQITPVYTQYDVLIHLHTKRSNDKEIGEMWRKHLYKNIFGHNHYTDNLILYITKNPKIGIMAPPPLPHKYIYRAYCESRFDFKNEIVDLLQKLDIKLDKINPQKYQFPAGNMFIIKTIAIKQIFDYGFKTKDFPPENGQSDHTIMHTIERVWHYVAKFNGYGYKECRIS